MKKEIEKNDMGDLIIGGSESYEEAFGQIDILEKEFQILEEETKEGN